MSKKPCIHEYLADNQTGKVLMCRECGVVHLHLHNLSLRFDTDQFAEFSVLMTQAAKKMSRDSEQTISDRTTLSLVH